MTPAQSSEPVSSVAELLALALAARDPDELLCRLCEWWQRATRADEVLIGAATGVGDDWSYARCDRQQPAQPVRRGDHGADGQTHDAGEAPSSSEDPAVQSIPLAGTDESIGVIRLVGSKEAPPPGDWIAVTTSLLAHAGRLEARLLEDKLAALGEFAAGAGHEINNPLATILICAQRLQRMTVDPEQQRLLATIGGQALRVRDMIGDTMLFARPPAPDCAALDLNAAAAEVVSRFEERCGVLGISIDFESPSETISVWADPTQLRVVISELLRNAIEAQPDGGRIEVTCGSASAETRGCAELVVIDSGGGLDDTSRQHLFDPFYSGRPAGRGLGFGLSKVWRIVNLHGGRVDASESPAVGLMVTVQWPVSATQR